MTTHDLKTFLASCLKEKIQIIDVNGENPIFYILEPTKLKNTLVDDYHWLHIVREVEEKLSLYERSRYAFVLIKVVVGTLAENFSFELSQGTFSWRQLFHLLHLDWQQKATALHQVLGNSQTK